MDNFLPSSPKTSQRIVLIGFMGSGKTTIGKILAEAQELPFIELDEEIQRNSACKNIREIFEKNGEEHFRALEHQAWKQALAKEQFVISTGGGLIIQPNNQLALAQSAPVCVIHLQVDFEILTQRLANTHDRPLFVNQSNAKQLYDARQDVYAEYADCTVNTNARSPEQVLAHICTYLDACS